MKQLLFMAALLPMSAQPSSGTDRLCEVARAAVARFAESQGWQSDARCRTSVGVSIPADAVLQPVDPPLGSPIRSGPTTWAVRVQASNRARYVQRVPLSVAWSAPAWVTRRGLSPGALLQADDVELLTRRWPDGVAVDPGREETPLSGRLRQTIRAGELLTSADLLAVGALMRGDRVTVVLTEGAMEIRMPAQLLAAARVGDSARAQVRGRPIALEGRLIDAQTLKVDSE